MAESQMETGSESDESDQSASTIGISRAILDSAVRTDPGLFISGWEADDDGVADKDLMDPGEQVLTAAEDGDLELLKRLLEDHPDLIQVRDTDQYTPLHRAAYNNHESVVTNLVSLGASVSWRTESGWTPLHCAACWGCHRVVPVLLRAGADVNARSNGELTPLHLGALLCTVFSVSVLLIMSIPAVACSDNPAGAIKVVTALLTASGVVVDAVSGAGETPLMIARRTSQAMFTLLNQHLTS